MSSVFVGNKSVLAVQQMCGVIVCKQCKVGLPSERSAKAHLVQAHMVEATSATTMATKAAEAADRILQQGCPFRNSYFNAPDILSGSSSSGKSFFRPLQGIAITEGYQCTLCTACYTSEKGMREHLSTKHQDSFDEHWPLIERNGKIKVQSLFSGPKTKFFPVSLSSPIGDVRTPICSPSTNPVRSQTPQSIESNQVPSQHHLVHDENLSAHAQIVFNEMDESLAPADDFSSSDVSRSRMNPYIASTKFDLELQDQNIDMKAAAIYTGLVGDLSDSERLVVEDIKAYLLEVPALLSDIAPAVFHDINLTGERAFRPVSTRSVEKYARNFARLVISAMRVRGTQFLPPYIDEKLNQYIVALSQSSSCQSQNRLNQLHSLLSSICLTKLARMDSPKNLFIRHFIMFAAVVLNSRNQSDSFRLGYSTEMSPVLASLLYGISSCAVHEVHELGTRSHRLQESKSSSQVETRSQHEALTNRLEQVIQALDVENNNAASYVRKTLDIANSITRNEDVDFVFDTCQHHHLCGIVNNIHVRMSSLGNIVKTTHKSLESVFSKLLYGAPFPSLFFSNIADITDQINDKRSGASFLTMNHNKHLVRQYALWVFDQITRVRPTGSADFAPSENAKDGQNVIVFGKQVSRKGVEKWLSQIQNVQDMLLACTHISSGSPGRATELETLQLHNSDYALRNLYVCQGRVCIVTRYSKSRSLTGQDRVIPRFPDETTSRHFLTYLVLFRTLEATFVKALYGNAAMVSQLERIFVQRGTAYSAPRIRDVIRGTFDENGLSIDFNHFRHLSAGILSTISQASPLIAQQELAEEARAIAHMQAGHSTAVAEHNYARKPTDIPSITTNALSKYRLFSTEWHKALGLLLEKSGISDNQIQNQPRNSSGNHVVLSEHVVSTIGDRVSQVIKSEVQNLSLSLSSKKRTAPSSSFEPNLKSTRNEVLRSPPQRDIEKDLSSYLPSLRQFLKKEDALFLSENQLKVTQAVCDAQHDVLAVMPTGSGKSISVLLPAFLEGSNGTTVILVPLAALVEEYVEKCSRYGISVATWQNRDQHAQVYIISADHTKHEIENFLRKLQNDGRLRRIVFDEAHLIVLWLQFRNCFLRLPYALKCRGHYIQFVLLTATLPFVYRERLLQLLSIPSVVIYDEPTVRYNLKFRVVDTSGGEAFQSNRGHIRSHIDIMTDKILELILNKCRELLSQNGGRIQVFALYRYEAERLGEALEKLLRDECTHPIPIRTYHGNMPKSTLKDIFAFWKSNDSKVKVVVSTSAFGTGLDVPNVRAVYHFGGSTGLLEYAQETGRAGRDGLPAECTIIYHKNYAQQHAAKIDRAVCQETFATVQDNILRKQEWDFMHNYMTQSGLCRKNQLYYHVDGYHTGMCIFNKASINCDTCQTHVGRIPVPKQRPTSQELPLLAPESSRRSPHSPRLHSNSHDSLLHLGSSGLQQSQPSEKRSALESTPAIRADRAALPNTAQPLPVRRQLDFGSTESGDNRRQLDSGSTESGDNTLSQFRATAHSLQNICIPCLVISNISQLNQHRCKNMKNRCKRCFHLGHQVSACRTFDPKRKNYCFACSLSQMEGVNVHREKEFGGACFMGAARNLAWMLWAKDISTQNKIADAVFNDFERQQLLVCEDDMQKRISFYETWLKTEWHGIPNMVKLVLWWYKASQSQS